MGSNDLSVISTRTSAVVKTIPVGTRPHDIVISGDGRYAFVANTGSDDISVINLFTQEPAGRIPVGKRPRGIRLR
jgi:YVTN family beta-propeller protein